MGTEGYIVKRGAYANHPRFEEDTRTAFMAETDLPPAEAEAAFALWLAEGRVVPDGPLIWRPRHGDVLVPRPEKASA